MSSPRNHKGLGSYVLLYSCWNDKIPKEGQNFPLTYTYLHCLLEYFLTESMRGKLKLTNMRVLLMGNNADQCRMIRMVCYEFLCWSLLLVEFCLVTQYINPSKLSSRYFL